jgi:hypothetical protein
MRAEIKRDEPKKKRADEKICADCELRENETSLCLCFGRGRALKVKRTDLACNHIQPKKRCATIVACVLAFLQFSFPYLLNFSGR